MEGGATEGANLVTRGERLGHWARVARTKAERWGTGRPGGGLAIPMRAGGGRAKVIYHRTYADGQEDGRGRDPSIPPSILRSCNWR